MKGYQRFGAIKRTIHRLPRGLYDLQALPPRGWCVCCGAEVYAQGQELCEECKGIDN